MDVSNANQVPKFDCMHNVVAQLKFYDQNWGHQYVYVAEPKLHLNYAIYNAFSTVGISHLEVVPRYSKMSLV